jgi:hypothetical protein
MTMNVIAALCALLTALAAGTGVVVADRAWRRLRVRQASRAARIAAIEASYARDTGR